MRSWSRTRMVGSAWSVALGLSLLATPAMQAQEDGEGWVEVPDVPGLAKLDGAATLAADDGGSVVLVGFTGGKAQAALAWHSADGTSWEQVALPGAKGSAAFAATAGPAGFVAVGGGKDGGRIWRSADGQAWSDVGGGLAPAGTVFDVASTPDGYVAVGFVNTGKGKKVRSTPTAWTSSDGVSWIASALAKVPGAGFDVAAAPDGALVATLYQPQRQGPKTGRTFEILPPSLEFVTSSDGQSWRSAGDPFVENLGYLGAWDLIHAGDGYMFRADRLPNAVSSTPDGFYASTDGTSWERVPILSGIAGALTPRGDGAVAIGSGSVLASDDGSAWQWSYEEALADAQPRSLAALSDGRILAVGPAPGKKAKGSKLYTGTPPIDAPVLSSECLDPAVEAELADALFDSALPAPERERIAAALGALVLPDPDVAGARDAAVDALRGTAATETVALRIGAGEVSFPVCG